MFKKIVWEKLHDFNEYNIFNEKFIFKIRKKKDINSEFLFNISAGYFLKFAFYIGKNL